jgi:hypothetical protein
MIHGHENLLTGNAFVRNWGRDVERRDIGKRQKAKVLMKILMSMQIETGDRFADGSPWARPAGGPRLATMTLAIE